MRDRKNQTKKVAKAALCMQRYCWEQGMLMQAFYEMGDLETVTLLAKEAAYRALPDGRPAMIGDPIVITDPCSCGEALKYLSENSEDPVFRHAFHSLVEWTTQSAPGNTEGLQYHLTDREEFWADSIYMLPPFLALIGKYDTALQMFWGYWERLYDTQKGLISHKWDEGKQQFERKDFWGSGNGWTLAGLARLVALLPDTYMEQRKRLQEMAGTLLEHVLEYQREDGLFYDVLDDTTSFPEVNLCQMTAYAIYRGMADGWLSEKYLKKAEQLRDVAREHVDEYGFVCPVCGAPDFDKPGNSVEAQAFYLLMEAAAERYDARNR